MNKILILIFTQLCFFEQTCFGNLNNLLEMNSVLSSLMNALQNIKLGTQDLSDIDLYDRLKDIKNPVFKARLEVGIQKLKSLELEQRELSSYLLNYLFSNQAFADGYSRGGGYLYIMGKDRLSADETTDLITRILLVIDIVNDIQKKWPIKNDILNIVSLGAGRLFQDFLLLQALMKVGYEKCVINVIDYWSDDSVVSLKQIIKQDAVLRDKNIIIDYFKDASKFIEAKKNNKLMHVCYVVSPNTSSNVYQISKAKNDDLSSQAVQDFISREMNLYQLILFNDKTLERLSEMNFYVPYDINQIFIKTSFNSDPHFIKMVIDFSNNFLKDKSFDLNNLSQLFFALPKQYPFKFLVPKNGVVFRTSDHIMLSFYDIIKHCGIRDCLGYMAFEDKITRYKNIKDEPYWALNYEITSRSENAIIWTYDSDKKRFEHL